MTEVKVCKAPAEVKAVGLTHPNPPEAEDSGAAGAEGGDGVGRGRAVPEMIQSLTNYVQNDIKKVHKPPKLSNRKLAAVPYFLSSTSIRDICKAAHISESSYKRYMEDPLFVEELNKAKMQIVGGAMDILRENVVKAASKLVTLLDSDSDWLVLRTSEVLLSMVTQMRDTEQLVGRLEIIERKIIERRLVI